MASPRIPQHIALKRNGKSLHVVVDGVELPYPIAAFDPIEIQVGRDIAQSVRLTLVANHITIDDDAVVEPETVVVRSHAGLVREVVVVGEAEDDQAAFGIVEDGEHVAFRCADECTLQINGGQVTCGPGTSPACIDVPPEA